MSQRWSCSGVTIVRLRRGQRLRMQLMPKCLPVTLSLSISSLALSSALRRCSQWPSHGGARKGAHRPALLRPVRPPSPWLSCTQLCAFLRTLSTQPVLWLCPLPTGLCCWQMQPSPSSFAVAVGSPAHHFQKHQAYCLINLR